MKVESESLLVKKGQIQKEIDELNRKCSNDKSIISNLESQLQIFTVESNEYDNTYIIISNFQNLVPNHLHLKSQFFKMNYLLETQCYKI